MFGKNRNVVRIMFTLQKGFLFEATYFTDGDRFLEELAEKYNKSEVDNALSGAPNNITMSIVYYPEINEFNGIKNGRVVIKRYMC